MELEEKILNGAALGGALSVFMPWLSGEWLGGPMEQYSGFGFFHAFIGTGVFVLNLAILILSLLPYFSGKLPWTRKQRYHLRLTLSIITTTLSLAALSVLTRLSFESARMDIRFGVYTAIIAGIVTAFYAWLSLQDILKNELQEHFRHPEDASQDHRQQAEVPLFTPPPPPPPPPPMKAEEHRRHL